MGQRAIRLLLGISMVVTGGFFARAQQQQSFFPDLMFHFDCKAAAYSVSDTAVERFLQSEGFKALNVVRVRRERRMEPMLSDLFIRGIDQMQRIIQFMAVPLTPGSYSVLLYTRPPTTRATDLEEALLTFTSKTLQCSVRQISRHENGSEARGAYNDYFKTVEDSFRQAQDWERPPL